jgi:hypothetical protein
MSLCGLCDTVIHPVPSHPFKQPTPVIILLPNHEHVDINGAKRSQVAKALRLNHPPEREELRVIVPHDLL